ncbi:uncharacterized protein LOC108673343 isoform X2 [Hyalella azteca]|uniref:Uncharacterized protein LOC108673343 isoform X2 n=1 Tax=Hyalella azteca TaxID=294128 RepID=A0A979FXT7_HYAAZ|nr:uncharacterized protein LOC108673343 isoform X2 [Hyalella azteca]
MLCSRIFIIQGRLVQMVAMAMVVTFMIIYMNYKWGGKSALTRLRTNDTESQFDQKHLKLSQPGDETQGRGEKGIKGNEGKRKKAFRVKGEKKIPSHVDEEKISLPVDEEKKIIQHVEREKMMSSSNYSTSPPTLNWHNFYEFITEAAGCHIIGRR